MGLGMKTLFLLEEIPKSGLELDEELSKAWFGDLLLEQHLPEISSFRVTLSLKKSGRSVVMSGRFSGILGFECARCAEPSKKELQHEFARVFFPAGDHDLLLDMVIDVDGPDFEGSEYRGHALDIEPVLIDEFVMMLPMYPVCSPDCKGLCPVCGHNLNLGECGCNREEGLHSSLKVKLKMV